MNRFNLEDYELVETRLARFHEDYPTARVITEMAHYDQDRVVFVASLFKDYQDEKATATGYAEETRGEGYVNKTSHVENCETSAIGRALANAGYAPVGARPSREEMKKVAKGQASATKNGVVATGKQVGMMGKLKADLGMTTATLDELAKKVGGVDSHTKLSKADASKVIDALMKKLDN